MDDRPFWDALRAETETAVQADEEGVRLNGGHMDGWLVKKRATCLERGWHETWPASVDEKHEAGYYGVADSGTQADWTVFGSP